MERFIKGDIIVINFPFTDLSQSKRRPALVLASTNKKDIIICQITSQKFDNFSIPLFKDDFSEGELNKESYVRPNKLVTLDKTLVIYKIGKLNDKKIDDIITKLINILYEKK
jgi:mRNA interferase MazF